MNNHMHKFTIYHIMPMLYTHVVTLRLTVVKDLFKFKT